MAAPIKTNYELRYLVKSSDYISSTRFASYTNKAEAIRTARFMSKKNNHRIYYIRKITGQVIFKIGGPSAD